MAPIHATSKHDQPANKRRPKIKIKIITSKRRALSSFIREARPEPITETINAWLDSEDDLELPTEEIILDDEPPRKEIPNEQERYLGNAIQSSAKRGLRHKAGFRRKAAKRPPEIDWVQPEYYLFGPQYPDGSKPGVLWMKFNRIRLILHHSRQARNASQEGQQPSNS